MKRIKSELIFLILSIFLLILATGIYTIFGNRHSQAQSTRTTNSYQSSSTDSDATMIKKTEEAMKTLEKNPSEDNLRKAQEMVAKVKDEKRKKEFEKRLQKFSDDVTNQKNAEEAVTTAESTQLAQDIETAQAAIDKLLDSDQKKALQERLNNLAERLNYQIGSSTATETVISQNTENNVTEAPAYVQDAPAVNNITPATDSPTTYTTEVIEVEEATETGTEVSE